MDFMDKMQKKVKMKIAMYAALIIVPFFFLMMFIILVVELVIGSSNNNQSTGENGKILQGETGENAVFKVLCQNCDISGAEKSGIMGTEFMEKMSEMINLYNKLELEKERTDELDFVLLSTTIGYGKKMQAEIFSDSEKFGWWVEEESLTNRDINQFARESDITLENAQKFYKWASVSLGTPYALPDLNLRGLSGNLVAGKIVTTCDKGSESLEDLIKEIVKIERKLSGEEDTDSGFWDKILSIFGVKYSTDDKVLIERLTKAFKEIDNPDSDYTDLLVYLGLDSYEPDMQCPSGKPRYTYTKFMNYEQYKVYLEKVYVPETYINCDECLYKNSSDYNKSVLAKKITREIFELTEYNRSYLGMSKIDYIDLLYGEGAEIGDLKYFTSPIKSLCTFTSGYGQRGQFQHNAVDTTINSNDKSLYAAYDGIVQQVNYNTTSTLAYNSDLGYCSVSATDNTQHPSSSGIEVIIKHTEINGKAYYSRYVHLEANSVVVKEGQSIKKGDKIANMGNTGCSTGTHLHFELYTDSGHVDPSYLFKQCDGAEVIGKVKVTTTDNFVTPKKCMVGNLSLDEVITGLIKKDYSGAASNPEYVKSLAVVIRTKLMHETNWCNKKIDAKVDVDIENNQNDLQIYGYVIDTQGMVLNYSGELIENADYARFPCQWFNPNNWRYTNNTSDLRANFGDIFSKTNEEGAEIINKHNSKGCVNYVNKGGDTISVEFDTIPKDVKGKEDSEKITYNKVTVEISKPSPPAQDGGAQKKFSTLAARVYGKKYDYTWILNKFYAAKTVSDENPDKYMGLVDISTSPGLIDAKITKLEEKSYNSLGFTYGETLPGTSNIPTGNMSEAELETINAHLENYVDVAEQNAIAAGNINPKRARVMAAAYWLINNPFYRVQYQWGKPLEHDNYDGIGWDPAWSSVRGIECQNFVVWSLWNAGAKSVYSSWSELQHSKQHLNSDSYLSVKQVLDAGIEPGDVLRRSRKNGENGHWAIVMAVNYEDCYVEVAHAVSEQEDTKISRYNCGETFKYEHLYKLPEFYQD